MYLSDLGDSSKWFYICIFGVPEEERKNRKKVLEEITAENFLNLMIYKVQLTQKRFLKRKKKHKTSSRHMIIKFLKTHYLSGTRVRNKIDFLSLTT